MTDQPPPAAPKPPRKHRRRGRSRKPTGGRLGIEPKITDATIVAIATEYATGTPYEHSCALAGVSPRAGIYWLAAARQIVERIPGKPKDQVTGEEPEAVSPWPKIAPALLVRLLRAVEHARALDSKRRYADITRAGAGGDVIYERTEEMVNPKTGTTRTVSERRLAPPDWRAHAWVIERREGVVVQGAAPTGARPVEGQGGKGLDFLEIVRRAYELSHSQAPDPRALPPATIEGKAVRAS